MLYHDFLTNEQRQMLKAPSYFPVYERHFKKFVNQSVNFWEIGVFRGGSLQMWKRYLGPFAKIIGIDINPLCSRFRDDQIEICIGDQSDSSFLQSVIDKYGPPDIVLDDGSHMMEHVVASFEFLYDKLSKNGVYAVEDICTSYWDSYGGGLKREGTFIERSKDLVDYLNASSITEESEALPSYFSDQTLSINFYKGMVVFEKATWPEGVTGCMFSPKNVNVSIMQKCSGKEFPTSDFVGTNVALFGAGRYGREMSKILKTNKIISAAFIDSNKSKQGTLIDGIEVLSPEKAVMIPGCKYFLMAMSEDMRADMQRRLAQMGVLDDDMFEVVIV